MLNFREELVKIREKQYEEYVELILRQILQYYENPENNSSTDPKEINFKVDVNNRIIVKILDLDDEEGNYYDFYISVNLQSGMEAKKVLSNLQNLFEIQKYRIMYGKSTEKDQEFSVLID